MKKKLYKVLNKDMRSPFQGMNYKIGKEYHSDNFDTSNNECSQGFYATDWDGIMYSYRYHEHDVYECEVWGKEVEIDQFKRRYEFIKLLRKLPIKELKEGLKNNSKDIDLYHVSFPVNPLKGKAKKPTKRHINLLKKWASVLDSVWASVWDSVRDSVWDSVRASVRASVWASVWDSVWDSVETSVWDSSGAYFSSLFINIKKWKYIDHKEGENPFKSCIDLWHDGFLPSFDGEVWRLHSGENAEIVYEVKKWKN
jgi:hypothetical protein